MENTQNTAQIDAKLAMTERCRAFGDNLRRAREAAGSTTGEVARLTRIAEGFVVALEAGDFDKLPGAVFGRGFVRSIAKVLSLDSQDLVARYDACRGEGPGASQSISVDVKSGVQSTRFNHAAENQPQVQTSWLKSIRKWSLIGGGVVAVGLTVIVLTVKPPKPATIATTVPTGTGPAAPTAESSKPSESLTVTQAEATPVAIQVPSPTPDPVAPATSSTTVPSPALTAAPAAPVVAAAAMPTPVAPSPAPVVTATPPTTTGQPSATQEQLIKMVVSHPVRIKVGTDNATLKAQELKPDTYEFKFKSQADFLIYDAGSVAMTFNGRPVGSLGNKGRIRRISFVAAPDEPESTATH